MNDKVKIGAVVGPTACGKTAVSVEVAKRCGGEIICCDSMQVYAGMEIGTAAPSVAEMQGIPHHLFGFVEPHKAFSCADYAEAADEKISEITSRGKLPILVGGTGLYLDSVLLGCGDATAAPDLAFRAEMYRLADEKGVGVLHKWLCDLDPEAAKTIHPNNVKRVVRALEICRACGTKTEYDRLSRSGMRYSAEVAGLFYTDRQALYSRIDRRVDAMVKAGLVAETERLERDGVFSSNTTAAQAIGYKEILPYLHGGEALDSAIERLKTATRHYAKRQITWFSSKAYVKPLEIDPNDEKTFEKIVKNTVNLFNNL